MSADVISRPFLLLRTLSTHTAWDHVLVATHGGLIKHLVWEILGSYQLLSEEVKKAQVRNCSLTTMEFDRSTGSWVWWHSSKISSSRHRVSTSWRHKELVCVVLGKGDAALL